MITLLDTAKHVYHICLEFFGARLPIHQLRFAMAETLAHVIYLLDSGRIVEIERDGICYYSIKEGRE